MNPFLVDSWLHQEASDTSRFERAARRREARDVNRRRFVFNLWARVRRSSRQAAEPAPVIVRRVGLAPADGQMKCGAQPPRARLGREAATPV
ncbi:MAG: hypothetical protein WB770_12140 [Acidimicrobiales bacterium]